MAGASGSVHLHMCEMRTAPTELMLPDTDWTGFGECQFGLNSLPQFRGESFFNAFPASGMFNSIPSSVTCLEVFLTEFLPLKTTGFLTVDCSTCCLLEIPRLAREHCSAERGSHNASHLPDFPWV